MLALICLEHSLERLTTISLAVRETFQLALLPQPDSTIGDAGRLLFVVALGPKQVIEVRPLQRGVALADRVRRATTTGLLFL